VILEHWASLHLFGKLLIHFICVLCICVWCIWFHAVVLECGTRFKLLFLKNRTWFHLTWTQSKRTRLHHWPQFTSVVPFLLLLPPLVLLLWILLIVRIFMPLGKSWIFTLISQVVESLTKN